MPERANAYSRTQLIDAISHGFLQSPAGSFLSLSFPKKFLFKPPDYLAGHLSVFCLKMGGVP